jgi:putative NADH-flavin reductase
MKLFVLGASGQLGRLIAGEAMIRGHTVTGQSRHPGRVPPGAWPAVGSPLDTGLLARMLPGHDAVVFALGVDHNGPTTLFSDTTRLLIPAMQAAGVHRLVAITGIGAAETRGHGGWFYNNIIYPLFTRHRYADKSVQEELIAASSLDWTIVRPGPFADGPLNGDLHAIWPLAGDVQVNAVTREEVAEFVIDIVEQHRWAHARPLVGHLA